MTPVTATKPGQVVKKELTPTQAEEQWIKADEQEAKLKAKKDESAAVLEKHMTKRGITVFKRVALVTARPSQVLDQPAVKAFLGAKVARFMKTTEPKPRIARAPEPEK